MSEAENSPGTGGAEGESKTTAGAEGVKLNGIYAHKIGMSSALAPKISA